MRRLMLILMVVGLLVVAGCAQQVKQPVPQEKPTDTSAPVASTASSADETGLDTGTAEVDELTEDLTGDESEFDNFNPDELEGIDF